MEGLWYNANDEYESLSDIYAQYMFLNLKNEDNLAFIDEECNVFLAHKIINFDKNIKFFEYDLKYDKNGEAITIKPYNIICALWFIGIFPIDTEDVFKKNRFENKNKIYSFDEKSLKLKIKEKIG